ncbi:MAG: cupin domain-containing protein [Burkholderiales bacterium]|nr:cupin domain-containing protein [Burkholderiales bacterium]
MSEQPVRGSIRNVVEVMWEDLPGHFGGAYSKFLVRPETSGSRLIDYRISTYQPKGYVESHAHKVQEQIYHILEGEALMEMDGERRVVRKHDVIFVPAGIAHAIYNTGLTDLTFIVVTSPPDDIEPGSA